LIDISKEKGKESLPFLDDLQQLWSQQSRADQLHINRSVRRIIGVKDYGKSLIYLSHKTEFLKDLIVYRRLKLEERVRPFILDQKPNRRTIVLKFLLRNSAILMMSYYLYKKLLNKEISKFYLKKFIRFIRKQ